MSRRWEISVKGGGAGESLRDAPKGARVRPWNLRREKSWLLGGQRGPLGGARHPPGICLPARWRRTLQSSRPRDGDEARRLARRRRQSPPTWRARQRLHRRGGASLHMASGWGSAGTVPYSVRGTFPPCTGSGFPTVPGTVGGGLTCCFVRSASSVPDRSACSALTNRSQEFGNGQRGRTNARSLLLPTPLQRCYDDLTTPALASASFECSDRSRRVGDERDVVAVEVIGCLSGACWP